MELNEMKMKLTPVVKRMPGYVKLAVALSKEPALGRGRKALLAGGVLYAISPVDLVPGFIPVAGQLDDIIVALGGLKRALKGLPAEKLSWYEERFGITLQDLEEDLAAAKEVSMFLLGKTLKYSTRTAYKLGKAGVHFLGRLVRKSKSIDN